MEEKIRNDLAEMKSKLAEYVDKGRPVGSQEGKWEPLIAVKPDRSKIKPLNKVNNYGDVFWL